MVHALLSSLFYCGLAMAVAVANEGASARASDTMSLEEAIQNALVQSPQLAETRARLDLANAQQSEALGGFLPTIGLTGHWFFYERTPFFEAAFGSTTISSLGPASPWLDAEASLKWPLFDGLRNVDRYAAARTTSRAADMELDYGTFSLRQNVRLAYFNVLAAERLAVVAAEDVKDLEDHRKLVEDQLRAGVATRVDLLRVDTQLSNAVSENINSNDEVEIDRQALAQLLGKDGDPNGVTGELPEPSSDILKAIDEARLERRADIEGLGLRAEAAGGTHRAEAKWWVPKLSLTAGYDAFTSQISKFTAYTLGVQLNWNIFDGLVSYSRSKEALANEQIAIKSHEQSRLQARTDYETYRRRYHYNLEKYRARADDVKRSTESMRLARVGFKAGTQTNTDVLDAEQDLFNARANQIRAQYGALESWIRFELAIGRNVAP
jgi:outer membrane protein TolC